MPDYQQGKIYRLVSNKTEDVYYGSTVEKLSVRKSKHKFDKTCSSRKLFENDAVVTIILVEEFPCNSKMELEARELFYIINNTCININKPFNSGLEYGTEHSKLFNKVYYENNKDKILERQKTNYENNKEIILKKQSEYYQNNKEAILERDKSYRESNKKKISEQSKRHYENNKKTRLEYASNYRQNNKQLLSEKSKKTITCECGAIIVRKSRHIKSTKHQEFLKQ